jgi:hypothetical protein
LGQISHAKRLAHQEVAHARSFFKLMDHPPHFILTKIDDALSEFPDFDHCGVRKMGFMYFFIQNLFLT